MEITRDDAGKPARIVMRKPADMHQHLRQGALLRLVAPMVAKRFGMAIVMPNTQPAITTKRQVGDYWSEIMAAQSESFKPLMTMYLTDALDPREIHAALSRDIPKFAGVKYYPRGLTTNSESGVEDPAALWKKRSKPYEVLRALAKHDAVLLLHAADGFATGEWENDDRYYSAGDELDPYDQEVHFIHNTLPRIIEAHPDLKISVEHLSTETGVRFMEVHGGKRLGCSITAQHLLLDRRDVFRGGFRPHKFWWPIIQPREHREVLRTFVSAGHPFVYLGSDSAPHPVGKKETDCCLGGVLMVHAGIELYAEAFEDIGCLERLGDFACVNGPAFYGLPPSKHTLTLERKEWRVAEAFYAADVAKESGGPDKIIPFRLGETVRWRLAG